MDTFLIWFRFSVFVALFLVIGWYGIKYRYVPTRLALYSVIAFYVVWFIDLLTRFWLSLDLAFPSNGTISFDTLQIQALLLPGFERAVIKILIVSAIAIPLWLMVSWYAHKTAQSKIDQEDALVLMFGILVSGWPDLLLFVFVVFFIAVIWWLLMYIRPQTRLQRIAVTPFFCLAGIAILIWGEQLSQITGLYAIR